MVAIQVQVRTVIGSNNEDYYTACTDYNGARIHATCIALVCYRVDYSISNDTLHLAVGIPKK